jgi:hypothetical protein
MENPTPEITEDTPFTPEDDRYHIPKDDNPLHVETNWWCFNIPERQLGCWLHCMYYPNQDKVRWRVFAWDPSGSYPRNMAYYTMKEGVPMPAAPDLRDITFPEGGYSVKMIEPLTKYEVGYADEAANFAVDFTFTAAHPPHRFTPGEPPAMYNPHIDQLGHFEGELVLRGERIPIDCWSIRDRTWGPREGAHASSQKKLYRKGGTRILYPGGPRWREIERERGKGRIQYIFGHVDDRTGFLSFVRPQDMDAKGRAPLNMGWLLKDGKFTRLDKTQSWMKNWRDPKTGWSQHMEIMLADRDGRTMEAEGVSVAHMCENGNGSNALMRWEFEGQTGWGEDQDSWRIPHFQRMLAALRYGPQDSYEPPE